MNEHEKWCRARPGSVEPCTCFDPPGHVILGAVRELRAELATLRADVAALDGKFTVAAGQINTVAELAGPAIEQLSASPIMRMLSGGAKRV